MSLLDPPISRDDIGNNETELGSLDWVECTNQRLLVALPALNEETTIVRVIEKIPKVIEGVSSIEVLVVDDGSKDRTAALARKHGAHVVRHASNRGVGAAFHTILSFGLEHGADLIVTIDSDGQFDPGDIPKLIVPIVRGEADFTTASRFKDPALLPEMSRIKIWGNRLMSLLISRMVGQRFYDVSCGMRAYSRRAARQLHVIGHFTYTQEVFLSLAYKQLHILEIPIRIHGRREFGESRVASNLFRYAVRTSQIIFRCYRDYYPMRFFGRLGALFGLSGIGLGAFFLIHYLKTGAFSPHLWAGFLSAALVVLALSLLHIGMIGDMMTRHRVYLEELLYHQRGLKHRLMDRRRSAGD